jgi:cell division septation protein DedD
MNGNITEAASWKIQYYLNVSSVNGTTSGSDWYDSGTSATAALNSLTVAGATGTQYVFTDWSGDASGTASPSNPIIMSGPKTAIANWRTQYNLTLAQSGVESDFSGNLITVNGTSYNRAGFSTWANSSDVYTFSYSSQLVVAANSKQLILTGVSGNSSALSVNISQPTTITGAYKSQYYLTSTSTYSSLSPANGWYDSGSSINAFVASPVFGSSGTQYVCTGWNGTGSVSPSGAASAMTFTISAPSTVAWNWKTQYLVSFAVSPSGDGTTSPSGTNSWQDAGSISISGTSSYNYRFSSWSADTPSITFGNSNTASTIAVISGPGNITANFVASPAATPTPTPVHTPTPTNSPTSSPQPTASRTPEPTNSSPTPVPSQSTDSLTANPYFYVLIVAIALVGVTTAIMVMRKRKKL